MGWDSPQYVYMFDQRIISQEPIANTDVLEELKQLLTTCDLDTMEEYFSLTSEWSTNESAGRA